MPETLWAFLGDETPEAEQLIGSMAAWSAQVQKSHGSNTEKTNEIKAIGLPTGLPFLGLRLLSPDWCPYVCYLWTAEEAWDLDQGFQWIRKPASYEYILMDVRIVRIQLDNA